jgi:PKD repeat protein
MTGSVSAKDNRVRIDVVEKALRNYLPKLPQPALVDLIAFNNGIVSERELLIDNSQHLAEAIAWTGQLKELASKNGGTHLWTTLHKALEKATTYASRNPAEPVIVRVLTDGEDNENVTTLDRVLQDFPLVDGEHIRGNLVILGDFELKTKLALPEGAFETTRNVHWENLFPPVILSIPDRPQIGQDVHFVENTRSVYTSYEWSVDDKIVGADKVLAWHFAETGRHRVALRVKGLDGETQRSIVAVPVVAKTVFTVEIIALDGPIAPGNPVRLIARPSENSIHVVWLINGKPVGSDPVLDWSPASEGIYEAKVVAWDGDNREASATRRLAALEPPLVIRIEGPQRATAGQDVQFASEITGPVSKLIWNFGDGATSNERNPKHAFALNGRTKGAFQVNLSAVSPAGHEACGAPRTVQVEALTALEAPVAAFSVIEAHPRVGDLLHLVDDSKGQVEDWNWEVSGEPASHDKTPAVRLANAGAKTISLTVRGPGGVSSISRNITVQSAYAPVQLHVAVSPATGKTPLLVRFSNLSSGDVKSWLWDFGDGESSTERSPGHNYTVPGGYTATVTAIPSDSTATPIEQKLSLTATKPMPLWAEFLLVPLTLALLGAIAWWIYRRHRNARLRLPVHYWVHDSVASQRFDLTRVGEARDIPALQLRISRDGASRNLIAGTVNGATLVFPDGQEQTTLRLGEASQLTVRLNSGVKKAVAIASIQKPRRPQAPQSEGLPALETTAANSSGAETELDWGWDKSPAK